MLTERYASYVEVSYRLWQVVSLLGTLRNSYPSATLHDCREGSDRNPVRLGHTALGSHLERSTGGVTLAVSRPEDNPEPEREERPARPADRETDNPTTTARKG